MLVAKWASGCFQGAGGPNKQMALPVHMSTIIIIIIMLMAIPQPKAFLAVKSTREV
jgi:hypothetical protein